MPPGIYTRTTDNLANKRTNPFFESDVGKKWVYYDGPLTKNKTYLKERNRWDYLGKNPYGKKKEIPDIDRRKKYNSREEAYEAQLQKQSVKIICDCGIMIRTGYMNTHIQTKKHHQLLSNLLPLPIMDFNIEDLPPPPIEWIKDLPVETKKIKIKVKKV